MSLLVSFCLKKRRPYGRSDFSDDDATPVHNADEAAEEHLRAFEVSVGEFDAETSRESMCEARSVRKKRKLSGDIREDDDVMVMSI